MRQAAARGDALFRLSKKIPNSRCWFDVATFEINNQKSSGIDVTLDLSRAPDNVTVPPGLHLSIFTQETTVSHIFLE